MELAHRSNAGQQGLITSGEVHQRQARGLASRSLVQFAGLVDGAPVPPNGGMPRLALRESDGQGPSRFRFPSLWELVHIFFVALELEALIGQAPGEDERIAGARGID